jgi:hypothetical protein
MESNRHCIGPFQGGLLMSLDVVLNDPPGLPAVAPYNGPIAGLEPSRRRNVNTMDPHHPFDLRAEGLF